MEQNLHESRKSYEKDALLEENLSNDPFEVFSKWFQDAENDDGVEEANAMGISTIGSDGFPKSRIVLLKEIKDNRFIFYTNYTSEKAVSIANDKHICIHFFWPSLERQVIIKAISQKASREKSASYFNSRPRGSQLGAWASHQTNVIESREELEKQLQEVEERFKDQDVPLPEFWGGFECEPVSFEYWQGRPNRLHDRILFDKLNGDWNSKRLQP
ncbi:Pyridoxamine 5'-phosphate oxidase [Nonlabens sp. Hel1_33_55]|uniref:pyridoxamine 5'-phosphate oxidase n=1 Tax=Nonlabens sp. Hel1_33_55 TaxID=1336802 RepID=UPI000875AF88|nr:pyridoxamine 5'-phosphate oxidase [Nonlabens sp. Hel1_33_55]SCX95972.1 Pyridoxamine 5'-phosphate oxidase [Nonlabens sp. Hel1_33_55]